MRMRIRDRPFVRKYGVAMSFVFLYGVTYYIAQGAISIATRIKNGHDFKPIYSEDGELQGFTHPRLVEVMNQARESNTSV